MPVVTAIKKQVKRDDRFSIYIDGAYSFSLSETELISSRLHEGDEVSAQGLNELRFVSRAGKLYDQVLRLLAARPRSEQEIRRYFKKKDAPDEIADTVMNRLNNEGRINDRAFAEWWIEQRRQFKLRSRRALSAELAQKGVERSIVDELLSNRGVDEDIVLLKELIRRKQRQTRYQDRAKLISHLARQGFPYGEVKRAFDELDEEI